MIGLTTWYNKYIMKAYSINCYERRREMLMYDVHGHMGKTSSGDPVDAHALVKDMDKYGIAKIGISSLSGTVNRVQNDLVYECYKEYPDRILPYAFINPKAPDAHEEIDLCLGERGFKAVKFHSWKHGYYADNTPQLDEILTHIEKYGVHVQTHVGTSPLSTPFVWMRLAKKHPNINFLFTHMGCREFGYSVIEAVRDIPNIYLETSVIYDTDVLLKVKECVGAKRIVFGTDWPYKSVECEIEKIYQMGFTDEELEYVFHKNAAHLWSME